MYNIAVTPAVVISVVPKDNAKMYKCTHRDRDEVLQFRGIVMKLAKEIFLDKREVDLHSLCEGFLLKFVDNVRYYVRFYVSP